MKITELIKTLQFIHSSQGEIEVVLQDTPFNKHPECCIHESFFIVEEPIDGAESTGMNVVFRTWPY